MPKNEVKKKDVRTVTKDQKRHFLPGVTMLTAAEVGEALGTTAEKVHQYRSAKMLNGICTGRSWMFPQAEILRFQNDWLGIDLSCTSAIEKALEGLNDRP